MSRHFLSMIRTTYGTSGFDRDLTDEGCRPNRVIQMSSFHIIGTGLFALDVIVRSDGRRGQSALGGSAGNVLSILGSLGWRITPVGMLGEDAAADRLAHEFSALGADLSFMLRSHSCVTPVIYQHQLDASPGQTHRFSFVCPLCGESRRPTNLNFGVPEDTARALPEPDVFFLDRATPSALAMARQFASQNGIVVFEPSSVGDDGDLFNAILQCTDIVKYAEDRIADLSSFDTDNIVVEIKTAGARGLSFKTHGKWCDLSAFEVDAVQDTCGAGDWCTAGLLYKLLGSGVGDVRAATIDEIEQALTFGQFLSAMNCMTQGARGLLNVISAQQISDAALELFRCENTVRHIDLPGYRQALKEEALLHHLSSGHLSPVLGDETVFCCTPL
jgi:fructokinase